MTPEKDNDPPRILSWDEARKPGVLAWAIDDAIQEANDPRHRQRLHLVACAECGQPDRCYGPWCVDAGPHLEELPCDGCARIKWGDDERGRTLTPERLAQEEEAKAERMQRFDWPGKKAHYTPWRNWRVEARTQKDLFVDEESGA